MPSDLTDDEIADAIADRIADAVSARQISPEFRRRLVSLYTRQALGLEKPPGKISSTRLALHLGIERHTLADLQRLALAKLWQELHARHPDLLITDH